MRKVRAKSAEIEKLKRQSLGHSYYLKDLFHEQQDAPLTLSDRQGRVSPLDHEIALSKFGYCSSDRLIFEKEEFIDWTIWKSLRRLQRHVNDRLRNQWTVSLFEKPYLKNKRYNMVVRPVSPLVGWGVYAQENIPAYAYIGEYTGVVRRRDRRKRLDNNFIFGYTLGSKETPLVIDAQKYGNFTRFINHSDSPNIVSRSMIIDGVSRLLFFAPKPIAKGVQLTYDYGPYYWRKRPAPIDLSREKLLS